MRHVSDVHHAVDVAALHPRRPVADLVRDLLGRADGDEERPANGVEVEAAVQLVRHGGTGLELIDREVAGRGEIVRARAQVVGEEMLQMADVFALCLLLRFRHIDES